MRAIEATELLDIGKLHAQQLQPFGRRDAADARRLDSLHVPPDERKLGVHAARLGDHDVARLDRKSTSELQSLMRISYAVFCLKKKKIQETYKRNHHKYTHQRTL